MGMGTRAMARIGGGVAATALAAFVAAPAWAQDLMGQPTPGGIGLQPAAAPLKHEAIFFHDVVLMPVITVITLLVLGLLIWIAIRYNKKANPVPAKWSHNTVIEVIWTVVPVLILVGISLFSFRLLFAYHDMPKPDLTVKATGNQWNWTHAYPDQGNFSFTSIMLTDAERQARIDKGIPAPRLLAVDNEVVVPVNKVVHVLVTSSDVIHNWTVPSFASKVDAVPGRITSTWFKAQKEGIFFGQCSELCGKDHAFMPISVRVVKEQVFNDWIAALKARDRKKAKEIIRAAAIELDSTRKTADSGVAIKK